MLLPVIVAGMLGAGWLVLDRNRGQTYRHLRKLDMEGLRLKKITWPLPVYIGQV
ncbi:hypothetical protein Q0F98_25535 [Paenibacillus amylolyticus]|nr:hypothetical protein Q0F98_25535 [Paenibacillus amylolyticus]